MIKRNLVFMILVLFVSTTLTAKQNKMLVCHVGNEVGPGGETFLDDPDCEPSDLNDYFCPDAGKIDLIVIAEKAAAKHLVNPSHYWDGISDYDPIAMGASGDDTEDSDGNGVDDGCEIPVEDACPCWGRIELQAVTETNQMPLSCNAYNEFFPYLGLMQALEDNSAIVFRAYTSEWISSGGVAGCDAYHEGINLRDISEDEALVCISQIYDRCEELDRPVIPDVYTQ